MKKAIYLFLAVVFAGFGTISCSSDDNKGGNASIVGKWEIQKTGVIVGGQEILFDYEHEEGCSNDYREFTSNGKMYSYNYWKPEGSSCEESINEYDYTVSGNTIITNSEEEGEEEVTILMLNSTTLKVKAAYIEDDEEVIVVSLLKRI